MATSKIIGKVAATEKTPTTIDEFCFWTKTERILSAFDVVKVEHIKGSVTYGVIEEIAHITDSASYLSNFISSDFGDAVESMPNTSRIGMNYAKAKVVGNNKNIYTPVRNDCRVELANELEIKQALGLDKIRNPLPGGYLEMYDEENKITLPVHFNSHFIIGPEGAHLNISGISGLAAKTSYGMFLMKAIQHFYLNNNSPEPGQNNGAAFVIFNVKGRDLLAIDEPNEDLVDRDKEIYKKLDLDWNPFENVKYFYPSGPDGASSYAQKKDIDAQIDQQKAFKYQYRYGEDKDKLDLLFSNVDDSTGTMDSIISYIISGQENFGHIRTWSAFIEEIDRLGQRGSSGDKEISVTSWRKFKRIVKKTIRRHEKMFANGKSSGRNETRLQEEVNKIKNNDVYVVDIAKLDEETQAFVFGDAIRSIYDMKLGQSDRDEHEIPSKVIVFIDELNKYASKDVPKDSPILRQIIDITERGRSLGIILFSAEQFKSAIHDRVKGNCATHAYGRTNAIEVSKADYRFIPQVNKNMMTRLEQGEYILENPVFKSLLSIKFPKPVYKQFKNG